MIYVICGPTCSGKTEASITFARLLNCPIINADAFQVYKDMNIGTAKISKNHPFYKSTLLLDIVTPDKTFSVKEYQDAFRKVIEPYKDKNVVVCGGTGLYIKAALFDYVFHEEDNVQIDFDFEKYSNEDLYKQLWSIDQSSALKIHPNNRKRVIRALTIAFTSDKKKSEYIAEQKHELIYPNVKFLFINPDRKILYNDINSRVDEMFDNGLIDEVKILLDKYVLSQTSSKAIGYEEVISYIAGDVSLDSCKEMIKKRTRNYAKRQVTFFKHQFKCEEFKSSFDLVNSVFKDGQYI